MATQRPVVSCTNHPSTCYFPSPDHLFSSTGLLHWGCSYGVAHFRDRETEAREEEAKQCGGGKASIRISFLSLVLFLVSPDGAPYLDRDCPQVGVVSCHVPNILEQVASGEARKQPGSRDAPD